MKDSFLNFEYNCEKISLEAITVQKKKGGQGLIETQYRSLQTYKETNKNKHNIQKQHENYSMCFIM